MNDGLNSFHVQDVKMIDKLIYRGYSLSDRESCSGLPEKDNCT